MEGSDECGEPFKYTRKPIQKIVSLQSKLHLLQLILRKQTIASFHYYCSNRNNNLVDFIPSTFHFPRHRTTHSEPLRGAYLSMQVDMC